MMKMIKSFGHLMMKEEDGRYYVYKFSVGMAWPADQEEGDFNRLQKTTIDGFYQIVPAMNKKQAYAFYKKIRSDIAESVTERLTRTGNIYHHGINFWKKGSKFCAGWQSNHTVHDSAKDAVEAGLAHSD